MHKSRPLPTAPTRASSCCAEGANAPRARRLHALCLAAIVALAFALRIGVAHGFQGLDAPPDAGAQPDQVDYERIAFHLSEGLGYTLDGARPTALRPPGTSWTLLPAYLAFGRSYAAGRVWLALLSSVTCLVVARIARRAFGRGPALFAALWLALYPGHFYYPMHFLSETPYGLALALACLGAWRAIETRSLGSALLAGVALGAATLARPQALFVLPLALLAAAALPGRGDRLRWRALGVGVLGFALALAPWVARNAAVLGKASISSIGGCTFWGAHNERVLADATLRGYWIEVSELADAEHPLAGGEFAVEAACWRYGTDFVRSHAGALPGLAAAKLRNFITPFERIPDPLAYWVFALGWILSAPLALYGLAVAWRTQRAAAVVLLVPILATFATVIVFYGSARFRDSLSAVLAVPAGLAADRLLRRLRAK